MRMFYDDIVYLSLFDFKLFKKLLVSFLDLKIIIFLSSTPFNFS